jgi:uncharacterized cupredoxin-like copper-binding protein
MPAPFPRARRSAKLALVILGLCSVDATAAEDPLTIEVTLKDHKFTPSEVHVKSGKPTVLHVKNQDPTAEEFESSALKVEKVIAANSTGIVRLRPLAPGRYPFEGEFHDDTAKGVVVAE